MEELKIAKQQKKTVEVLQARIKVLGKKSTAPVVRKSALLKEQLAAVEKRFDEVLNELESSTDLLEKSRKKVEEDMAKRKAARAAAPALKSP